jgi:hypothetical protein
MQNPLYASPLFVSSASGPFMASNNTITNFSRQQISEAVQALYSSIDEKIPDDYDPRVPLIIIALVLFLLDIAVRKFKWKWIHELVRARKEKLAKNANNGTHKEQL